MMPQGPRIAAVLGCVAAGAGVYALSLLALGVRPRQVWAH
jgi:hypothetical protein